MSESSNNDRYVEFLKRLDKTGILPKIKADTEPDERRDIHAKRAYHINAAATLEAGAEVAREIRELRCDIRTNQPDTKSNMYLPKLFGNLVIAASFLSGAFIIAASSDQDSAEAEASHTCVVDTTKTDADVQRQLDVCEQARQGMGAKAPLTIEMK